MLDRSRDYSSRKGADILAENIRRYWAQRGRRVRVEVVPSTEPGFEHQYVIRSNIGARQ